MDGSGKNVHAGDCLPGKMTGVMPAIATAPSLTNAGPALRVGQCIVEKTAMEFIKVVSPLCLKMILIPEPIRATIIGTTSSWSYFVAHIFQEI